MDCDNLERRLFAGAGMSRVVFSRLQAHVREAQVQPFSDCSEISPRDHFHRGPDLTFRSTSSTPSLLELVSDSPSAQPLITTPFPASFWSFQFRNLSYPNQPRKCRLEERQSTSSMVEWQRSCLSTHRRGGERHAVHISPGRFDHGTDKQSSTVFTKIGRDEM